MATKFRTWRGH